MTVKKNPVSYASPDYCLWQWDGRKWLLLRSEAPKGARLFNPNRTGLDIRGRRPFQTCLFPREVSVYPFGADCGYCTCIWDAGAQAYVLGPCSCNSGCAPGSCAFFGPLNAPYSTPCLGMPSGGAARKPPADDTAPLAPELAAAYEQLDELTYFWTQVPEETRQAIMTQFRAAWQAIRRKGVKKPSRGRA